MKSLILSLILVVVTVASTEAQPPRRSSCGGGYVSSPCYTPVHHEEVVIVPPIVVTEYVPTIFFQNVQAFIPSSTVQPQFGLQQQSNAPPAFAPGVLPPVAQAGVQLSDAQMERLADIVARKLAGAAAVAQNTLITAPPAVAETPPATQPDNSVALRIVNDVGSKCASCHQEGVASKGGLTLFDAAKQFSPKKSGQPYTDIARIAQRAEAGEMPPSAATDPSKRLNPESITFLKQVANQQ